MVDKDGYDVGCFKDSQLMKQYERTDYKKELTVGVDMDSTLIEQENILRKNYIDVMMMQEEVPTLEIGIMVETGIEEMYISMKNVLLDKLTTNKDDKTKGINDGKN